MSLYNMLFGENELADAILATLGLTKSNFGRYRDCFITENKIAVYTRNGGGNREDYQHIFDTLSTHPNYLYDKDDEFDYTYATIYFSFPEEFKEELMKLDSGEKFDPSQRWLEKIEEIRKNKRGERND